MALVILLTLIIELICSSNKQAFAATKPPPPIDQNLMLMPVRRQIIWSSLIDWNDPENWLPHKRLPCPKDEIVLPDDYILFLNQPLDAFQLVLPQNGELVIGSQANIRFTIPNDGGGSGDDFHPYDEQWAKKCPKDGSRLEFTPNRANQTVPSWFNPDNWNVVFHDQNDFPINTISTMPISNYATFLSTNSKSRSMPKWRSIVPHSERVPCANDWVHFPTVNGSFKVTIERSNAVPPLALLTIGSMRFGQTAQFREFAHSFRGSMLFDIRGYNWITIMDSSYLLSTVPQCDNDSPKRLSLICAQVRCPSLDSLPCADPIKPRGHCCPICASAMIISIKVSNFKLNSSFIWLWLRQALNVAHQKIPWMAVYMHRLYDGSIQLVVGDLLHTRRAPSVDTSAVNDGQIDRYNDRYIQVVANEFRNRGVVKLLANNLGIEVYSSVDWRQDSLLFMTIVVRFFVTLFIISLLLYPMYAYYVRNRMDPAFTFVRFRSHSDIELEVDPSNNGTSVGVIGDGGSGSTNIHSCLPPTQPTVTVNTVSPLFGLSVPSFSLPSSVSAICSSLVGGNNGGGGGGSSRHTSTSLRTSYDARSTDNSSSNNQTLSISNVVFEKMSKSILSSSSSGDGDGGSGNATRLTENFENPIFQLFHERQVQEEKEKEEEEKEKESSIKEN